MPTDPKIVRILEKVKRSEDSVDPLFKRMDRDWDFYTLKRFKPLAGEGIRQEDAFNTNLPKIVADKLSGAIAGAKQIVRTEVDADNQDARDVNSDYERFAIGALKIADRNLEDKGGVPVRTELGFRGITQGRYVAARALLLKDDDGETVVDVTPIHPRELLIWHGKREPSAAAIITMRPRGEIREEYPKFKFDDEDQDKEDEQRTEKVVDYYFKEKGRYMNAVIVASKWAKSPTDQFTKRFPIIARAVGTHSGTSGITNFSDHSSGAAQVPGIETFGESIYAPVRGLIEIYNRVMSYHVTMTARGVRQVMKVKSRGGTKELESAIDDASEINLDVDNLEDIEPLVLQELTRDADKVLQQIAIALADGTLPEQSFGRLPAPISGNALRILGSSVGERLNPFLRPVESCIEGIIEALAAQYETGNYKAIKVTGKTRDRQGFSRVIEPDDIKGRDRITIELVPDLPTDRREDWLTAQIATQPGANGVPLASHFTAREDILHLQDADLENERIFGQMARVSSPKTVLMTQLVAAQRQGDEATVQFMVQEIQRIVDREAMEELFQKIAFASMLAQNPIAAAVASGQDGNGQNGSTPASNNGSTPNLFGGIPPEFLGLSGIVPGSVDPSSQAGDNTTGPRSVEERANAMGITIAQR